MKYAKIVVKNNYEKRGDLVLRSYVRALKKINAKELLNNDTAYIYGKVDDKGVFHELFTRKVIDYNKYEEVSKDEVLKLSYLSIIELYRIARIIKYVLFNESVDFDYGFEVSSMEDLAIDRIVEMDAYDKFLSRINPYMRLSNNNDLYNAYNNFQYKIQELKIMEELDNKEIEHDEYDVNEYQEVLPSNDDLKGYIAFKSLMKTLKK